MQIVSHHIKNAALSLCDKSIYSLYNFVFMKKSSVVFILAMLVTVGVLYTTKASAAPFDCGGKKSDCCTDKGGVKYFIDLIEKNQ